MVHEKALRYLQRKAAKMQTQKMLPSRLTAFFSSLQGHFPPLYGNLDRPASLGQLLPLGSGAHVLLQPGIN